MPAFLRPHPGGRHRSEGPADPYPEGETQQTYQVHLGGGLVSSNRDDPGLGRTVRGLKVTPDDLTDYVERLTRRFLEQRADDESFAQWAHRAEEDSLR